jgi:hypothetical protein
MPLGGAAGRERGAARSFAGAHSLATPLSAFQRPPARRWLARQRSGPGGGRARDSSPPASRDLAPGPQGRLPVPAGRPG